MDIVLVGASLLGAGLLIGAGVAATRYRAFVREVEARLAGVERTAVSVGSGTVEYAVEGDGTPALVSHGIFHGCDGGLVSAREVFDGHRILAPSRFGYLGSSMPPDASSAAQADAFVELLDALGVEKVDALGISAGTGAAVQLAARHPDRVAHLIISSGNWPGSPTATAPPDWAKAFYNDPAMWALRAFAPGMLKGMMGVPAGFPRDDAQAARMARMLDSVFPIAPRVRGAIFDAFVSNPEIADVDLEHIAVPTLVLHAKDDPLASYDAAVAAAERIPGAKLVSLESGGHIGLGQTERVRREVAGFLSGPGNG